MNFRERLRGPAGANGFRARALKAPLVFALTIGAPILRTLRTHPSRPAGFIEPADKPPAAESNMELPPFNRTQGYCD